MSNQVRFSQHWAGIYQVMGDCTKAIQTLSDLCAYPAVWKDQPDSVDVLRSRLEDEFGDAMAALSWFARHNELNVGRIEARRHFKAGRFQRWFDEGYLQGVNVEEAPEPEVHTPGESGERFINLDMLVENYRNQLVAKGVDPDKIEEHLRAIRGSIPPPKETP